jgi:RimJ/RimL family protein N-acetyltransferase
MAPPHEAIPTLRVSDAPAAELALRTLTATHGTLEPQVEAHAAEMFEVLSDPAIYEFENAPPPSAQWLAERYRRLEARGPADGSEQWLNWVVRLPGGALAGYVQASVLPSAEAFVAYELGSTHWRQGIGSSAVRAMLEELRTHYGVRIFVAVLKARNFRSEALLRSLGFESGDTDQQARYRDEPDELVMVRRAVLAA